MAYLVKQVGPVRPLLAKIQAVLHFRVPRTRCEIRRDLGMAGYYRGFCKKFADVVAPLTSLTGVSKPLVWSSTCQKPFQSAKAQNTSLCHS